MQQAMRNKKAKIGQFSHKAGSRSPGYSPFWVAVSQSWFVRLAAMSCVGSSVDAVAIALLISPAQAAELTSWQFDPITHQLAVSLPTGITPRYFLLAQPARIVMDLPDTQMGDVPAEQTYSGAVRQIRVAQFQEGLTRIVIELSPDTVLAPGQVQLQQAAAQPQENAAEARWVLRPLIAGESISSTASNDSVNGDSVSGQSASGQSASGQSVSGENATAIAQPTMPATLPQLAAAPVATPLPLSTAQPTAPATLPSSEPSAVQFPIELPPSEIPPTQPASTEIATGSQFPVNLPPATLPDQRPVRVTVPPLRSPISPPANIPPLTPLPSTAPRPEVEFGQPSPTPEATGRVNSTTDILLPSGTLLSLLYPGNASLMLRSGTPRQEVLVLQQPILDRSGYVLIPQGSQVVGRFETGSDGSQFIAQALTLQGRNVRLNAKSDILDGDRQVSQTSLIGNSALGSLALGIIGGFTGIGFVGGALAGAATTYLIAPQPATIQPNQVVEVRLLENLPR
jgi:hypothetical protein